MNINYPYYITKMVSDFEAKQKRNPTFSLRAYAKYLGIPPSSLSLIIKGKRPMPQKLIQKITCKLNLSASEEQKFTLSANFKRLGLKDISKNHLLIPTYNL